MSRQARSSRGEDRRTHRRRSARGPSTQGIRRGDTIHALTALSVSHQLTKARATRRDVPRMSGPAGCEPAPGRRASSSFFSILCLKPCSGATSVLASSRYAMRPRYATRSVQSPESEVPSNEGWGDKAVVAGDSDPSKQSREPIAEWWRAGWQEKRKTVEKEVGEPASLSEFWQAGLGGKRMCWLSPRNPTLYPTRSPLKLSLLDCSTDRRLWARWGESGIKLARPRGWPWMHELSATRSCPGHLD